MECLLMPQETWVQSQVASYQRLKKWYLIPPCLTPSIIRYVSRVTWVNPGKGVAPFSTPWWSSLGKGSLRVTLDYGHQLYLLMINCIIMINDIIMIDDIYEPEFVKQVESNEWSIVYILYYCLSQFFYFFLFTSSQFFFFLLLLWPTAINNELNTFERLNRIHYYLENSYYSPIHIYQPLRSGRIWHKVNF